LRFDVNKRNLQNLPSNSKYGKLMKSCFIAPKGWILLGADYDSLESKINALLTRDPNQLAVFTDGYDGHCLRAFAYFGDQMPDINNSVDSINSIAKEYGAFRQDSKAPT
jgi:DNA polymerase-1